MIENIGDNESSSYNIDISHRNSVTCREGESRRRNLIRNNFPFQMVEHYDEEIEVEEDTQQDNYNKDKYRYGNVQKLSFYQDEINQQENVNDISIDYRNEQLLIDSMTFNNPTKDQKINITPINKLDNFSNMESLINQNTNTEEFNQFQGDIQMNTSYQQPINQSTVEYQNESYKTPLQNRNLNQANISNEITNGNSFNQNDHTNFNSHQNTNQNKKPNQSLNIIQSLNQYTSIQNVSKPNTNTEVITVSLNSVQNQNSDKNQNTITDLNKIQHKDNQMTYTDALISFDKSDQHLKFMSSRKNVSEFGSRIIDNNSSQITPIATPVAGQATNRQNRKQNQKLPSIVIQGVQGWSKNNLEEIKEVKKITLFNFKFFKRTQYIKKFITNLKNKSSTYIFRHINSSQFNLISDQSAEFSYFQNKGMLSQKALI